ncbi:hypothetical protein BCR34DRAFT_255893 [Clohesyomyces aquaticus]|uniref:Uncharacterized protein n=1 Tax=Clohesyomyces aquaticus TaxID=1231657 RepID=A0A1Y1ZU12_9PLEO|nr:hypothetical protein BCR34DRAFT_255893 [Clohesyomyces aquaticus]
MPCSLASCLLGSSVPHVKPRQCRPRPALLCDRRRGLPGTAWLAGASAVGRRHKTVGKFAAGLRDIAHMATTPEHDDETLAGDGDGLCLLAVSPRSAERLRAAPPRAATSVLAPRRPLRSQTPDGQCPVTDLMPLLKCSDRSINSVNSVCSRPQRQQRQRWQTIPVPVLAALPIGAQQMPAHAPFFAPESLYCPKPSRASDEASRRE